MNTSMAGGFFNSLTPDPNAYLKTSEQYIRIPENIIINISSDPETGGHQEDQPEVLAREYSPFLKQANLIEELNKKHG